MMCNKAMYRDSVHLEFYDPQGGKKTALHGVGMGRCIFNFSLDKLAEPLQ